MGLPVVQELHGYKVARDLYIQGALGQRYKHVNKLHLNFHPFALVLHHLPQLVHLILSATMTYEAAATNVILQCSKMVTW